MALLVLIAGALLAAAFHNWLYDRGYLEREPDDGTGDFY